MTEQPADAADALNRLRAGFRVLQLSGRDGDEGALAAVEEAAGLEPPASLNIKDPRFAGAINLALAVAAAGRVIADELREAAGNAQADLDAVIDLVWQSVKQRAELAEIDQQLDAVLDDPDT